MRNHFFFFLCLFEVCISEQNIPLIKNTTFLHHCRSIFLLANIFSPAFQYWENHFYY